MPDNVSDNGELAAAINMANDGAALSMLEQPQHIFELNEGETLMAIHRTATYYHYIVFDNNDNKLKYIDAQDDGTVIDDTRNDITTVTPTITEVKTMGNTIVYNDNTGINYVLWRQDDEQYKVLGQKPPQIDIQFSLDNELRAYPSGSELQLNLENERYTDRIELPWIGKLISGSSDPYQYCVPPQPLKGQLPQSGQILYNEDFSEFSFSLENAEALDSRYPNEVEEMVDEITQFAMAGANKFVAEQTKKNRFVFPFFIRYAYELYDGSTIMASYPTLMVPNSKAPVFGLDGYEGLRLRLVDAEESYEKVSYGFQGRVYGFASELYYDIKSVASELDNWKDIIRGVNIYITPQVITYDQQGKVYGWTNMDNMNAEEPTQPSTGELIEPWIKYYAMGRVNPTHHLDPVAYYTVNNLAKELAADTRGYFNHNMLDVADDQGNRYFPVPSYKLDIPEKPEAKIIEELAASGTFFMIKHIDIEELRAVRREMFDIDIEEGFIDTLESRQTLKDDFFTRDTMAANVLHFYNRRLYAANISRTLHSPLIPFTQWQLQNYYNSWPGALKRWSMRVFIKDENGAIVLAKDSDGTDDFLYAQALPKFLFYPNPNAYKMQLSDGTTVYEVTLKEHQALNGAYWMGDLWDPYGNDGAIAIESLTPPTTDNTATSEGEVIFSNVENPFSFNADASDKVGEDTVLALCAAVRPLSEGQFGQFPLYAFTTQGVWALTMTNDGRVSTIQAVTRDIIIEGTTPLSLDQSVVYTTQRGVMMLTGSTAKCITETVDGTNWVLPDVIKEVKAVFGQGNDFEIPLTQIGEHQWGCAATMAYDYANQRIYFTPLGKQFSWVFNIKTGLWTHTQSHVDTMVNAYPDCMFTQQGVVVRMERGKRYDKAVAATRPIKFVTAAHQKIMALAVQGFVDNVATALRGTRDWKNYPVIASSTTSHITRRTGTPYKAHTITLLVNNDDKAAITSVAAVVETEHTDKLR